MSQTNIIIIAVIIAAIVIGGGVYLWMSPKTTTTQPTTQVSPTSEQTQEEQVMEQPSGEQQEQVDTYAGWKTYTNEKYNYELEYPNDWYVKTGKYTTYFGKEEPKLAPCDEWLGEEQPMPGCEALIIISSGHGTPSRGCENQSAWFKGKMSNLLFERINLGAYQACKVSGNWLSVATDRMGYIVIPPEWIGKKFIEIIPLTNDGYQHTVHYYQRSEPDYTEIINQILSTFKFTK